MLHAIIKVTCPYCNHGFHLEPEVSLKPWSSAFPSRLIEVKIDRHECDYVELTVTCPKCDKKLLLYADYFDVKLIPYKFLTMVVGEFISQHLFEPATDLDTKFRKFLEEKEIDLSDINFISASITETGTAFWFGHPELGQLAVTVEGINHALP